MSISWNHGLIFEIKLKYLSPLLSSDELVRYQQEAASRTRPTGSAGLIGPGSSVSTSSSAGVARAKTTVWGFNHEERKEDDSGSKKNVSKVQILFFWLSPLPFFKYLSADEYLSLLFFPSLSLSGEIWKWKIKCNYSSCTIVSWFRVLISKLISVSLSPFSNILSLFFQWEKCYSLIIFLFYFLFPSKKKGGSKTKRQKKW